MSVTAVPLGVLDILSLHRTQTLNHEDGNYIPGGDLNKSIPEYIPTKTEIFKYLDIQASLESQRESKPYLIQVNDILWIDTRPPKPLAVYTDDKIPKTVKPPDEDDHYILKPGESKYINEYLRARIAESMVK